MEYAIGALIVGWAVYCLVRHIRNSKKGCGCGCEGCSRKDQCDK